MQRFLVCWGVAEAKRDSANCLSRFCSLHVRRFLHHLPAIYTFSSGNSSGGVDQARQENPFSVFQEILSLRLAENPSRVTQLLNHTLDQSSSAGITLTHWTDVVDNLRRWEIRWCQEKQVGLGGNNEWLSPVWLTSRYQCWLLRTSQRGFSRPQADLTSHKYETWGLTSWKRSDLCYVFSCSLGPGGGLTGVQLWAGGECQGDTGLDTWDH